MRNGNRMSPDLPGDLIPLTPTAQHDRVSDATAVELAAEIIKRKDEHSDEALQLALSEKIDAAAKRCLKEQEHHLERTIVACHVVGNACAVYQMRHSDIRLWRDTR